MKVHLIVLYGLQLEFVLPDIPEQILDSYYSIHLKLFDKHCFRAISHWAHFGTAKFNKKNFNPQ